MTRLVPHIFNMVPPHKQYYEGDNSSSSASCTTNSTSTGTKTLHTNVVKGIIQKKYLSVKIKIESSDEDSVSQISRKTLWPSRNPSTKLFSGRLIKSFKKIQMIETQKSFKQQQKYVQHKFMTWLNQKKRKRKFWWDIYWKNIN